MTLARARSLLALLSSVPPLLLLPGCGDDDDDDDVAPSPDAGADAAADEDAGPDAGGGDPLHVETAEGPVQGVARGQTRLFLGIPYAAPPVGELRWKAPQPVAPWSETLDASAYGPPCPQTALLGGGYLDESSEDCLTLNVWSPADAAELPVMVFLHGGGFSLGTGADPGYDGQSLSQAGHVLLVTINYRLGALGYLSHPDVDDDGAAGAYGLADQQAALDWVQRNAAAFGGDPTNVTLFGESAGGTSVWLHLVAPASRGKFARAILESGVYFDAYRTLERARLRADALVAAVGCDVEPDVAACLRGKTAEELVVAPLEGLPTEVTDFMAWAPAVGGDVLPEQPNEAIAAGDFADVPVVLGTNRDEGTFFIRGASPGITPEEYEAEIEARLEPELAAQVLERYPPDGENTEAVYAELFGDLMFVCPARRLARAVSVAGRTTFRYSFERPVEVAIMPGLGAFHAAELPFVFGNEFLDGLVALGDEDLPLSASIQGYWTRHAANGDPNGADEVAWPTYDEASDEHLTLDLTIAAGTAHKAEACDFWDTIPL